MKNWLLFFLLIPSLCMADSETTFSGKTAQAHIIQASGSSLRPRPYLDFEGCTGQDLNGKTVITCGSGGGGSSWNITDGVHTVNGVTNLTVTGGTVGGTTPNGTLTVTGGSGNGNVGIGTTNWVSYYPANGTTVVANSDIQMVGLNVGIGSPNPQYLLDVQGTERAIQYIAGSGLGTITGDATGNVGINTTNGQNVGIGSFNPGQRLDVNGTVRSTNFSGAGTGLTGTASSLSIGGNSATATALTANGTNCSGGNYPLGVDASGNSESCTVAPTECASSSCNLNSSTTLNSKTICLQDGTNCPSSSGTNYWSLVQGTGNVGITTTNTVGIGTTFGNGTLEVFGSGVGIGTVNPMGLIDISPNNGGLHDFVDAGGNIGIGTVSNAVTKLFVVKAANNFSVDNNTTMVLGGSLTCNGNGCQSGGAAGVFGSTSAAAQSTTKFQGGGSTTSSARIQATSGVGLNDYIQNVVGNNGGTEVMRIQDSATGANVGIGTVAPLSELAIFGNVGIGTVQNGDIYLTTTAPQGGMMIEGNVGIGSFNPGQKLDVKGTVRMNNFNMPTSPTNNFVLTSDANGNGTWQASQGGGASQWVYSAAGNIGLSTTAAVGIGTTFTTAGSSLVVMGGNVGVGTWVPAAQFDAEGSGKNFFGTNVGLGTLSPPFTLSVNGVIGYQGTSPSLTSCGTSPSIAGTDVGGTVTVGGTATACTISFIGTYAKTPSCEITNQSMSVTNAMTYTVSTSAIVVSQAVGLSSDKLNYHCDFQD